MSTENKKKRGRPPGSGKKKKVVIVDTESGVKLAYTEERDDIIANGDTEEEVLANLDTMHKIVKKHEADNPETFYPSNWNDMGKIAKLEWLTAHPRK